MSLDQNKSIEATFNGRVPDLPEPVFDGMIDPTERPCPGHVAHDPVVADVIDDEKFGPAAVVRCRQCGSLCDPSIPWMAYREVEEK